MSKLQNSYPIKIAIKNTIEKKCRKCTDIHFCKLSKYYEMIEAPTIKDLENLTKCFYYKK